MDDSNVLPVVDPVIRRAAAGDTDAVGRLWEKLVAYHRSLDERLPEAANNGGDLYARRIMDRINDTHTGIFVAEVDGEIVGFVLGLIVDLVPEMFRQLTGGFLADIYVDDAFRRCGVGRQMVSALVEWFEARGVQYMEWYVASENAVGRAFWENVGGRAIMVRMRLNLSS